MKLCYHTDATTGYDWHTGKIRPKQIPSGQREDVRGLIARRLKMFKALKVLKRNLDDLPSDGSKKENDGKGCIPPNVHPNLQGLSPARFDKNRSGTYWSAFKQSTIGPFTSIHYLSSF